MRAESLSLLLHQSRQETLELWFGYMVHVSSTPHSCFLVSITTLSLPNLILPKKLVVGLRPIVQIFQLEWKSLKEHQILPARLDEIYLSYFMGILHITPNLLRWKGQWCTGFCTSCAQLYSPRRYHNRYCITFQKLLVVQRKYSHLHQRIGICQHNRFVSPI